MDALCAICSLCKIGKSLIELGADSAPPTVLLGLTQCTKIVPYTLRSNFYCVACKVLLPFQAKEFSWRVHRQWYGAAPFKSLLRWNDTGISCLM